MCTLINQSLGSCGQLYKPLPHTSSPSRRFSLLWSCTSVYSSSFSAVPGSKFVVAVSPVKKRLFELIDLFRAWWRTGSAESVKADERRERAKWIKFPPDPEPIHGRTCQVCGGKLVLVILYYHWDHGTDVATPADKAEKCLSCGRLSGELEK